MSRSWMPIYWGDFLRDTRHLNKFQRDSYMMLIAHYWTAGALPHDDRQLAKITDCTLEEWMADKSVVQAFFFDGWRHKRIERELKHHMEVYAKRLAASEKGAAVLAMKRFRTRN
jgi:uncharacterized protein YdaU (DUF1376 family)